MIHDCRFPKPDLIPAYLERYFPKIRSLYLYSLEEINEILPLNFNDLTDLRIGSIPASSLKYIKLKQLRKFTFNLNDFGMDIASIQTFVNYHCDLEYLNAPLFVNRRPDPEYETEYYRLIIEGFPNLKTLKMRLSYQDR